MKEAWAVVSALGSERNWAFRVCDSFDAAARYAKSLATSCRKLVGRKALDAAEFQVEKLRDWESD